MFELTADLLVSFLWLRSGNPGAADWLLMRSLDDSFLGKPSGDWLLPGLQLVTHLNFLEFLCVALGF